MAGRIWRVSAAEAVHISNKTSVGFVISTMRDLTGHAHVQCMGFYEVPHAIVRIKVGTWVNTPK